MNISKIFLILFCVGSFFLFESSCKTVSASEVQHHGILVENSNDTGCMECHGEDALSETGEETKKCSNVKGASHPIQIYYPPKGKEKQFKTGQQAMEQGIRFENGMMTCISCHNLEKNGKGHLAVDNYNSRLCMACHKM